MGFSRSSSLVLLAASVTFAVTDVCTGALATGGARQLRLAPLMVLSVLPAYLVLALALWLLVNLARRAFEPVTSLFRPEAKQSVGAAVFALLPALALFVGAAYALVLFAAGAFNNRTLSAFLVVLGLLALAASSALLWVLLFWAFTRSYVHSVARRAQQLAKYFAPLTLVSVLVFMVRANLEGLQIVGPRIYWGPLAGILAVPCAAWLLARYPVSERRWARVLGGLAAFAVLAATTIGYANPRIVPAVVSGDLWSAKLVIVSRALTDVDRDGFSWFFGGGDCAPFDRTRSPGAIDIPKDGIDNDCFGGDRTEAYQSPPPRRYPRPEAFARVKNAVVITIESMRFDALSFLNPKGPRTTPNIDELAAKSTVFRRTYSSADATVWAMGSFWTTLPPAKLVWRRWPHNDLRYLDKNHVILPDVLRRKGFDTHAFVVDFVRLRERDGMGLERGFDTYDSSGKTGKFEAFPSKGMVDKAVTLLEKKHEKPFLLWVHLIEPHGPYKANPGAPNFGNSSRDLYHSEVWGADRQVGRLIDALRKKQLLDTTLVFVTGDHGEAFGEHGKKRHGSRVYDEQTRTIGVLWVPGTPAKIVEEPISHQDFGSTLFNLLDVDVDFSGLRGRNLMPLLLGQGPLEHPSVIAESHAATMEMAAIIKGKWKLVYTKPTGLGELFDLETDPGELEDLSRVQPAVFATMMDEMRGYLATQVPYD